MGLNSDTKAQRNTQTSCRGCAQVAGGVCPIVDDISLVCCPCECIAIKEKTSESVEENSWMTDKSFVCKYTYTY